MVNLTDEQPKYLGTGLSFPLQSNVQGGLKLSAEAQKVKEAIWLILRTDLGERVYRPDFGCRLSELAFAPLNNDTLLRIRIYVLEALQKWEPRIDVDEVRADPDTAGRVNISIDYRLKSYPDPYSFVYPFYLVSEVENSEL
ncbi:GPW/gp25 family protein [Nostocaceae cyanobacterium CENA369]|uniref:GPW/gp25 family protein n=1 Tax=Dendronalium phyllosphericum CENA369 TaxID=1725256 RepID=A0A8J7I0X2_9NOST|nr:GPW/gp25 family protein [Dendronalium phyllosphericum]MBH8572103.1 GPW/gp25 family protein [Dendronalium phyllosphericum CENA369]